MGKSHVIHSRIVSEVKFTLIIVYKIELYSLYVTLLDNNSLPSILHVLM